MQIPGQSAPSRLMVLMFTDVVGSVDRKTRFGTPAYSAVIARHDQLFKAALRQTGGDGAVVIQDTGDGHYVSFPTPSAAVRCALRFQHDLFSEVWPDAPLKVRIGIHLGEMAEVRSGDEEAHSKLAGLPVDLAARITALAVGGQILLTRATFNDARQFIAEHPLVAGAKPSLRWIAHGPYLFKGMDEACEVFEVGAEGIAPLAAPASTPSARRVVPHDLEETLGWRPAIGLEIPARSGWTLERKLGEGGFGEVWLGQRRKLHDQRVFKFCFDPERLRSFKREMTLFRLLRDALGDRADIAKLHEVKLDESPFFLESDYTIGGNFSDWAKDQGGIQRVPLATRLDLLARIADAVAAAHGVGILHKDIKPSNILVYTDATNGQPRPRLSDFGIGMLTDRRQLSAHNITDTGFTLVTENDSSRTGTRMYAPPEILMGKPFTARGDIYALGILLYQLVIGDLARPLAVGWERDVPDELLRDLITACIDGDPQRRLGSAAELAARLRGLDQLRIQRKTQQDAAARRKRNQRIRRIAAVAMAVLLLVAGITMLAISRHQSDVRRRIADQDRKALEEKEAIDAAITARRKIGESYLSKALQLQSEHENFAAAMTAGYAIGFAGESGSNAGSSTVAGFDPNSYLERDSSAWKQAVEISSMHLTSHPLWRSPGTAGSHGQRIAFSPDGRLLVTTGDDGLLRVWDSKTGQMMQTHRVDRAGVDTVASILSAGFGSDGKTIIARWLDEPAVTFWNPQTNISRAVLSKAMLPEQTAQTAGASLRSDGKLLAWISGKQSVSVSDAVTGEVLRTVEIPDLDGPTNAIQSLCISPDAKHLAVGYAHGTPAQAIVCLWNLQTAKRAWSHSELTAAITSLCFSPDGSTLVSSTADRPVRLWDVATGKSRNRESATITSASCVAFSPDGLMLACGSTDGRVRIWDAASFDLLDILPQSADPIAGLNFSPDGNTLASCSRDGTVCAWDVSPARTLMLKGHTASLSGLAFSADGKTLASGSFDRTARLWDTSTGKLLRTIGPVDDDEANHICSISLTPDGSRLATAHEDSSVRVWAASNSAATKPAQQLNADAGVLCACYSPDGALFAAGSRGAKIQIWDNTGKPVSPPLQMVNHNGDSFHNGAYSLCFSPDGKMIAAGGRDGWISLWETSTARPIQWPTTQAQHHDRISGLCFSPDGSKLASASWDGSIRFWKIPSGESEPVTVENPAPQPNCIRFSPDGKTLASGSKDGAVRLWDTTTGHLRQTLTGPASGAWCLAFSPDGKMLAAPWENNTIRIWNIQPNVPMSSFLKFYRFDGTDLAPARIDAKAP